MYNTMTLFYLPSLNIALFFDDSEFILKSKKRRKNIAKKAGKNYMSSANEKGKDFFLAWF